MHKELKLNENFLIFLFHIELRKKHEDYFLHYTQNYTFVNIIERPAFTLKYVTQRFIQIVINPSATRSEFNLGIIAARQKAYIEINEPLTMLNAILAQSRAVKKPDKQYVKRLVKYCRGCKKFFYTQHECND